MKKIIFILTVFCLVISCSVRAYVMSSPNYRIQSDSINVGGTHQESNNYTSEDTIGEIATGESTSTLYKLKAGYQQMQESYISMSFSTPSVELLPSIGGLSGGMATGTVLITVITDNPAGYSLYVNASTSPTLESGSFGFADYTPSTPGTPDFAWAISSLNSEFGFTPEGTDIVQKFKDDSSHCATGTNDTVDKCWYNASTSAENISQRYLPNHPAGTQTTLEFKAESGQSHFQEQGTYQATITSTLVAN
jgi:hypothetical protein